MDIKGAPVNPQDELLSERLLMLLLLASLLIAAPAQSATIDSLSTEVVSEENHDQRANPETRWNNGFSWHDTNSGHRLALGF